MLVLAIVVFSVASAFIARELHFNLRTRNGDQLFLQVHPSGKHSLILESDGLLTDSLFFSTYLYYQQTAWNRFDNPELSVVKMIGDMLLEQYDISDGMTRFHMDQMSERTQAILGALQEFAPSLALTLNSLQIAGISETDDTVRSLLPAHLQPLIPKLPTIMTRLLANSLVPYQREINSKLDAWEKGLQQMPPQLLSSEFSFTWNKHTAEEGKSSCTVEMLHGRLKITVLDTANSIDQVISQ